MRNLHNLLFLFLSLAFRSNALADACPKFLTDQIETEVSSSEKALAQITKWALKSHIHDREEVDVLQIPPESLKTFALSGNQRGQLVYSESQAVIKTTPDLILIGIWNLKNSKPENLYGFLDPTNVTSAQKHSSFNSNQPVMSAWSLETENGYLSKISDNSGHYRPSPLHVYLALKKFQSVGVDVRETVVILGHGIGVVRGLQISAENFIEAIENLNSQDYEKLRNPTLNSSNMSFFLNLIYRNTENSFTKALINLLAIRTSPYIDYDKLKKIVKSFNDPEMSEAHIETLLDALFKKNHYLFRGKHYFSKDPDKQIEIKRKVKNFILEKLAEEKNRLNAIRSAESIDDSMRLKTATDIVNGWFIWNQF